MTSLNITKKGTILRVADPTQGARLIIKKGSIQIIRIGIQGPPGPGGTGSEAITIPIPSGETRVVDSFQAESRKWIVSIKSATGALMAYEMTYSRSNLVDEFTKFGLLGERLAHQVQFAPDGLNRNLVITNNIPDDMVVTVIPF